MNCAGSKRSVSAVFSVFGSGCVLCVCVFFVYCLLFVVVVVVVGVGVVV